MEKLSSLPPKLTATKITTAIKPMITPENNCCKISFLSLLPALTLQSEIKSCDNINNHKKLSLSYTFLKQNNHFKATLNLKIYELNKSGNSLLHLLSFLNIL